MLKFFHGTHLEKLAEQLIEELDENPPENLLAPEIFVVQNHGIGQWLSLYMADRQGIAANLEFEFPSERIWKLIRLIDPDIPQNLPSDRQPMTWSLMQLFSDEQVLEEFDNIRHYIISAGDPDQHTVRRWKLASKIADVFDQYLMYRPQMILDWEKSNTSYENKAEAWQARLWNNLLDHWERIDSDERWHRAQLLQQIWNKIDNRDLNPQDLPDRISVFGVSSASPAFIDTLVKLSKLTEVYFYQLSVDPQIKESNDYQNPLLKSLGGEGTNFIAQLLWSVKEDQEVAENLEWKSVDDSDISKKTIFGTVQSDIIQDQKVSGSPDLPTVDSSIQVHSCHSPMREVEVLYDQLLAILDENPDMNSDSILIMTPDLDSYAPMIEAVFETPDEGQPEIPYSIADRGVGNANIATESFTKILDLCESRFKVTDVMDLLDMNPVQEAFEFTDEELNKLERWIRDNRIRWGIDGKDKQQMNLPESDHFTWQAGLRRIMLGYMMRPDKDSLYQDIFAYDEVETSDDAELAGKISHFLNRLFEISRQTDQPKSPQQWQKQLNKIVDQFLPENRDYFWEASRIREVLNSFTEHASLAGYDQKVSFSILRRWLEEQLQEQSSGGGRIGRGVTFSSLMPMRSIPFDMIGMIGMNEGSFPRSKIPIEFDLMHLDPQPGDPKQSEEDRYLFLENLLSARTHFYVSYVGQSNRQNATFPPSVVIQEFLDYLEEYYELNIDEIVTNHRLQAFSPHYFTDKDYFSYSQSQMNISRRLSESTSAEFFTTELPEPDEEWKQLTVGDLISFFQHPIKFLLRNRLGIYLREEDVMTEDREPFALDKLDEYKVGQELLTRFLDDQSLETYDKVMHSRDLLPEGWSGEQAYNQKSTAVKKFGNVIQQRLDQQQLDDLEADLKINGYRITGTLPNIFEGAQIAYRFGKARAKDKAAWWIRHLLFQLVKPEGHSGKSLLFTWDNDALEENSLPPVEDAEKELAELLDCYWQGLQKPLQLYCKSSYAFAENFIKEGKSAEKAIEKAIKKWEPIDTPYFYMPGECDDVYNKLVMDGKSPFKGSAFREISCDFWEPFFDVLNKEGA